MEIINPIIIEPIIFYEIWKPITEKSVPNVKDGYYISNYGRVCSTLRRQPIIMTETPTWNGYLRVNLALKSGISRYYLIHRIEMIEFFCVPGYKDLQVNHKNGNKMCNFYGNLEWITLSENIIHAYRTGLKNQYKGEECSYATITNEQAEQIAKLLSLNKYSHKEISEITGVQIHIIDNISGGATWRYLYDKYNLKEQQRESRPGFSDEDLHKICKYFEENKYKYNKLSDLYRAAMMDIFNIRYNQNMSATFSRIFNHKTRKDITDKYNF